MISGVLPINKPEGITSFDVIRKIKKVLRSRKIGHGGTLDPIASGVLPILIGEGTKIFDFILQGEKVYRAIIQLGAFTETDDREGDIIESFNTFPELDAIKSIIPQFIGEIMQTPPRYSAVRVNGKRSYELARKQNDFELKMRKVLVNNIILNNYNPETKRLELEISCGTGTYIRSIARDIGKILNCGAYIQDLIRLKSAGITLDKCYSIEQINDQPECLDKYLIDMNTALSHLPFLELNCDPQYIIHGKPINNDLFKIPANETGFYKIVVNNNLLAIIENENGTYKYIRVFNTHEKELNPSH